VRKSNREKIVEAALARDAQAQRGSTAKTLDLDGLIERMLGDRMNPTQREVIYSQRRGKPIHAPIKAMKGNAGGGKTTTILAALIARMLIHPGYRAVMCRYDYNKMEQTVFPVAEMMLQRLPPGLLIDRDKSAPMTWWVRSVFVGRDEQGREVNFDAYPSQLSFMGLKDYPGGLQVHGIGVDEADEVEERVVTGFYSRTRELFPTPKYAPDPTFEEFLAFNPPEKTHWLYEACTGMTHDGKRAKRDKYIELYEPDPKENEHHLRPGYYDDLAAVLPEDQRERFIKGEWGSVFKGQPVYREYISRLHGAYRFDEVENSGLNARFWDFGYRRPYCCWNQMDAEGRLITVREFMGENEEITPFARRVKMKTRQWFPEVDEKEWLDFGDPAASQKKDTGSTLVTLKEAGIALRYVKSFIDDGVKAGRLLLELMIRGEPAWQINARNCPWLSGALRGGYRLDDDGVKPVKDGTYDHPADAWRYGVVNLFGTHGGNSTHYFKPPGEGRRTGRILGPDGLPASLEYDPALDVMPQGD
jgi:hypothetical protein